MPGDVVNAIIARGEAALAEAEQVMPGAAEVDQIQEGFDALRADPGPREAPARPRGDGERRRFI
jgi:hypothetical protein